MKIHISNSAFLGNIDSFFTSFDPNEPEKFSITANENWISVHPLALSMIAVLGMELDSKKIECPEIIAKSGHYLKRMGLFDFLGIESKVKKDISEHDPSGRFIPLTQIKNSIELTKFLTDMVPLLHLAPEKAESIRYVVSELVRNVLEHSQSKNGAILCAQYFKKSNTIRIGIVDRGIGIRASLARSHPTENDLEAIRLSLEPGITGTTRKEGGTEQNAGAGLFFIKSIAYTNRNFFVLYSGNGMYKLLKRNTKKELKLYADPGLDRHSEGKSLPFWKGTAVGIDISLESKSDFTLLLDLIRDTYSKAVRERRKEKYRKPKFI